MAVKMLAPLRRAWDALRGVEIYDATRVAPADPNEQSAIRFFGGTSTYSGVRVDHEIALRVSAVWACIDVIASALAASDWNVYEGQRNADTKTARPNDPLQYTLNCRFNPEMTAQAGKRALAFAAVGYGNGYAEIERDTAGRIRNLWPIEPDRVQAMRDRGTGQLFYRVTQDTQAGTVDLLPEEVFHIRGASLIGIAGDDVLNRAIQSIAQAVAMDQFASGFFGNNAQLGTVFMYKGGKLDDAHYDRLRQQMEEKHRGARKAFRSAILDGGDWDVKTIGSDINGSQLVAAKQLSIEEICRWFRVPPHKIAHLLRATNNNIEHQGLEFSRDTLRPWVKEIEQEADYKLFPMRGVSRFVELDVDWAEQGDYKSRAEAFAVLRNIGVFSANDILRKLGENTIGKDGDIRVVQGANVKLEDVGAAYAQPAAPAAEPEEPEDEDADTTMAEAWLRSTYARLAAMVENRVSQNKGDRKKAELDGYGYMSTVLRDVMPHLEANWPGCRALVEARGVEVIRGAEPAKAAAECFAVIVNSSSAELGAIRASIDSLREAIPKQTNVEIKHSVSLPDIQVAGATVNVPEREVRVNVEPQNITNNVTTPDVRVTVGAPEVTVEGTVVNVPEQPVNVTVESPIVNVAAPHVQMDAPIVNVAAPDVSVNVPDTVVNVPETVVNVHVPEQKQPIVNVQQAAVTVQPPKVDVHVEAKMPVPEVTVNMPARQSETQIERDQNCRIVRSTTFEQDAD
jgi:HK97 family phage portal protein